MVVLTELEVVMREEWELFTMLEFEHFALVESAIAESDLFPASIAALMDGIPSAEASIPGAIGSSAAII